MNDKNQKPGLSAHPPKHASASVSIGSARVEGLHVVPSGCRLELSLSEIHNFGYRRDGEPPQRVCLTLRVTAAEAVYWLPFVGCALDLSMFGIPFADSAEGENASPSGDKR